MPTFLIYPIYTGALVLIAIGILPKAQIRRLAVYGMVFGAFFDILAILFLTHLLGVGGYINYGPFAFMGIPFFPTLAWSIFFMMYLYLLPRKSIIIYGAPVAGALYSVFFSNILQNLGIFSWNYGRILVPFLIYISWFSIVTWAYIKLAYPIKEKKRANRHFYTLKPAMTKRFDGVKKMRRK